MFALFICIVAYLTDLKADKGDAVHVITMVSVLRSHGDIIL